MTRLTTHGRTVSCFAFVFSAVAGCQTAGSWQFSSTNPPGLAFPLERIELNREGGFQATSVAQGNKQLSRGQYRWRGNTLLVGQDGFEPQRYHVKRHWDGSIEFMHKVEGKKVTARFTPVSPEAILEASSRPASSEKSSEGDQSVHSVNNGSNHFTAPAHD